MSKIYNPKNNVVYVFSSIYNHLDKVINFIDNNEGQFILNGNICHQNNDDKIVEDIQQIISIKDKITYILGDKDLNYIKNKFNNLNYNYCLNWILDQDKYCTVYFSNQTSVTIVCGGVTEELNNIENCFINSEAWHENYDGKFGFVISNYPVRESRKIYEYSCSIGVDGNHLAIQKINSQGLKDFQII